MQKVTLEDGQSANIIVENVERLKELFPDAFTEGGVNFDVLRQVLGDESVLDQGEEKYGLNWHGKRQSRQIGLTPSTGTLLPCPNESIDWASTQNVFIEGDNLESLKLLQKSYANSIKLIYIDPPYNTGGEFVYPDKYQDNLDTYLRYTNQIGDEGLKISSNTEVGGKKHTNWMNMMLPRLMAARQLLRQDGIILISIDDNEYARLKLMCEAIFGEENFLASLIWNKQHSQQQGLFKRYHEYILAFAKDATYIEPIQGGDGLIEAGALKKISRANPASEFEFPAGTRFDAADGVKLTGTFGDSEKVTVVRGVLSAQNGKTTEPVVLSAGWTQKNQMKSWFAGQETFDTRGQKVVEFYLNSKGKLKCTKERGRVTPSTFLRQHGMVSESTDFLQKLMGDNVFSNPKPVSLIQDFITWFTDDGDIVMDFFAGSGTTGHAVMLESAQSKINRQFILVQLPEPLSESVDEQATGARFCQKIGKPSTIAELTKQRLRLAKAKIEKEVSSAKADMGFRAFRLSTSNVLAWSPDRTDLEGTLLSHREHLAEGRSEEDVLYELLLKRGIELTTPVEERVIAKKKVYSVGFGVLFACLTTSIDMADVDAVAQGILDWHKELEPETEAHVFFRDSAFADDIAKTNMAAILEQNGISHVRSL